MQITQSNITLMVADLDRSLRFYTEVLGFTSVQRYGDTWAELNAPGLTIGLHPARKPRSITTDTEAVSLGLGVPELEAAIGELEAHGVAVHPTGEGALRIIHFTDPDGTPLYLMQV